MTSKIITKIPCGIITLCTVGVILYLTLYPLSFSNNVPTFKGMDKVIHCVLFIFLSMAFWLDFVKRGYPHDIKFEKMLFMFVLCIFIGGLTEYLQDIMKLGRTGDILDFLADMVGSIIGLFLSWKFLNRYYRNVLKIKFRNSKKTNQ